MAPSGNRHFPGTRVIQNRQPAPACPAAPAPLPRHGVARAVGAPPTASGHPGQAPPPA